LVLLVLLVLLVVGCAHDQVHFSDSPAENWASGDKEVGRGRYEQAGRLYDDALAHGYAPLPVELARRAEVFIVQQLFQEALQWLDTVGLARFPGDPGLMDAEAFCLLRLGRKGEAEEMARAALLKDATLCRSRFVLSSSAQELHDCWQAQHPSKEQ
jgi:hypothetical protein